MFNGRIVECKEYYNGNNGDEVAWWRRNDEERETEMSGGRNGDYFTWSCPL